MARVLIVEDDPEVRDFLADALSSGGHEVLIATDGAQGLRMATRELPDVLLTDIIMPGKGGFDLLKELQSFKSPPKIIAMSGAPAQWMVLGLARKLGARKTLSKPFSPQELIAAVNEVLAGSQGCTTPPKATASVLT